MSVEMRFDQVDFSNYVPENDPDFDPRTSFSDSEGSDSEDEEQLSVSSVGFFNKALPISFRTNRSRRYPQKGVDQVVNMLGLGNAGGRGVYQNLSSSFKRMEARFNDGYDSDVEEEGEDRISRGEIADNFKDIAPMQRNLKAKFGAKKYHVLKLAAIAGLCVAGYYTFNALTAPEIDKAMACASQVLSQSGALDPHFDCGGES